MKTLLFALLCVIVLLPEVAGQANVSIGPRPNWVEDVTFDANAQQSLKEQNTHYYLLLDEQTNFSTDESYEHYAYKILTTEGLQSMSDLTINHDPSYQQLIVHSIVIHRGSERINKLSTKFFKTIQREEGADRFLYDGTLTTYVNLSDVRVGDIVEYSFTIKGANPVLKGNLASTFYTSYALAYDKMFRKVIFSATANPTAKYFNGADDVIIEKTPKTVSYKWTSEDHAPFEFESNTPDSYVELPMVEFSTFAEWADVITWAEDLYHVDGHDALQLKEAISGKFKSTTKLGYAAEVTRFVQDEIRYLGFESGLHSHKPHSPLNVYQQRFGDCKDKSLLLIALLAERGIDAYPVFLSTTWKEKVGDHLPSPFVFDHCVVVMMVDAEVIYVDPTISDQGGKIEDLYFPRYGKGLVISGNTPALLEFPEQGSGSTVEKQRYESTGLTPSGTMVVETVYYGAHADQERSYIASNSLSEIQESYLKFYRNTYPELDTMAMVEILDDRDQNIITIKERYEIPSLWKKVEGSDDESTSEYYAASLESYASTTTYKERKAPFALRYPADFTHEITILPPTGVTASPEQLKIVSSLYSYELDISQDEESGEISIRRQYRTKASSVPPDYFKKFTEDHAQMYNTLNYKLTYNRAVAAAHNNLVPGIAISLVVFLAGLVGIYWLFQNYDPQPFYPSAWALPIGGWLILPGIGLLISPVTIISEFIKEPGHLNGKFWYTQWAAGEYPLSIVGLAENIFIVASSLYTLLLLVLFFKRRSSVPRLMIIHYAVQFGFHATDMLMIYLLTGAEAPDAGMTFIRISFALFVWVPYFKNSTRVKKTFVFRRNNNETFEPSPLSTLG
jgi:transglutaminase-like putative cysteine protease